MRKVFRTILFNNSLVSRIICILFPLCICLLLFIFYPYKSANLWKEYYTILLHQDTPRYPGPDTLIKKIPVNSLVMEEKETVSYSNFHTMEEIPIIDLGERFDPLDPRIDPYMHNKSAYFNPGKNRKALYINSLLHPLLFYIMINTIFKNFSVDVIIPDIRVYEILLCFFTGCMVSILFFTLYKQGSKAKYMGMYGLLPWIPGLLTGDILILMNFILLYPAWFFLFEEIFIVYKNYVIYGWKKGRINTLVHRSLFLSLCLVISIIMVILQGTSSFMYLVSLFTTILMIPGHLLVYGYFQEKKSHRIFDPVPIRFLFRKTYLFAKVKKIPFLLFIGVVIILFSIYYFCHVPLNQREALYPVLETEHTPITLGNLKTVWQEKKPGYMPDLSDYIVHQSYQEGLLYGTTYTFPSYTEGLKASYYEKDPLSGKIMMSEGIVKEYTKAWLDDLRSNVHRHSVEKMLFHQGKAVHVQKRPIGNFYLCRFPRLQALLLFAVAFIIVFFSDFYLTPSVLYDTKRFAVRRWSEAA